MSYLTVIRSHDRKVAINYYYIHCFWRSGMERPAGSRHSCAVIRGLQTAPRGIFVFALIP